MKKINSEELSRYRGWVLQIASLSQEYKTLNEEANAISDPLQQKQLRQQACICLAKAIKLIQQYLSEQKDILE